MLSQAALTQPSNLSGWHCGVDRNEARFVDGMCFDEARPLSTLVIEMGHGTWKNIMEQRA
ncbi:uncharacterized protein G2W53_028074 [Senna tora]|uniref:Uncharacterized protein n=1 Tax=Senna tora TaxID=362788 RepID=A0A834T1Y4_9FABA|nr:uncharacterized protein G2W53_028074 [Senna tora]